jgi:hypothetical protein
MVAMNVWPTDAADGSVSSEARWRKMGRVWAPSAVIAGQGLELAPSLAGTNLTVRAGACWVDGHYCELTSDQVLTVTANGIAVVRFDPAANTAELVYRDGVSTPAQSPTGTYELLIAQITASALTDARGPRHSPGGGEFGPWIPLAPVSGWSGGTTSYTISRDGKWVRCRGAFTRTGADCAAGVAVTVTVLPAGARPAQFARFTSYGQTNVHRVAVNNSTGDLQLVPMAVFATSQYFHIDEVTYATYS